MLKIAEKILLHQIRRGNQHAFGRFYDTYRQNVYRFVYFKVSDQERAQDLTDEIFLKIFDYLKDGQEIKDFRAVIFRIARNLVIDHYRSKERAHLPLNEYAEQNLPDNTDLEKETDTKLKLNQLEEAVKKLPEHYQEIIVLRFIDGLSFKEISKLTDKTEENCRMISHRGLTKLKEIILEKEHRKE